MRTRSPEAFAVVVMESRSPEAASSDNLESQQCGALDDAADYQLYWQAVSVCLFLPSLLDDSSRDPSFQY